MARKRKQEVAVGKEKETAAEEQAKALAEVETLRQALEEAKDLIQKQDEELKSITSTPLPYGTIITEHKNTVTLATVGGGIFEVEKPIHTLVKVGDMTTIQPMTSQILGTEKLPAWGEVTYVREVIDWSITEVDYQAGSKFVFNGGDLGKKIEKGDRVVLDITGSVIIKNLGKSSDTFKIDDTVNVRWSDIGGLEEAKQVLSEAIELSHRYPRLYSYYSRRPVKGVLLYGPSGCGKTMLGKATATALNEIYGDGSGASGFIYIKGPEILNKYVGTSEATIRHIFQRASEFRYRYGYPAVVFIDEADAILNKRGTGKSSDVEQTIVPMFLSEMDGMNPSDAMVILATNRVDRLDTAVIREGRIDFKVKVTRPSMESAGEIFKIHLRGLPLDSGETCDEIIRLGCLELFSPERTLYQIKTLDLGIVNFNLEHVISGSIVANVVDRAGMTALRRDVRTKEASGIRQADIVDAIDAIYRSNIDIDYRDDIFEFVGGFRDKVVSIDKVTVRQ